MPMDDGKERPSAMSKFEPIYAVVRGVEFRADRRGPYSARSASDKTNDWPLWFVHGADGVNCVRQTDRPMALFMPRKIATVVAETLNREARGGHGGDG